MFIDIPNEFVERIARSFPGHTDPIYHLVYDECQRLVRLEEQRRLLDEGLLQAVMCSKCCTVRYEKTAKAEAAENVIAL